MGRVAGGKAMLTIVVTAFQLQLQPAVRFEEACNSTVRFEEPCNSTIFYFDWENLQ